MRVLVGTPTMEGKVHNQFMYSFMQMMGPCVQNKVEVILYTLSQESLLPRGRNHIAQVAMKEKYDKCFFIDSDEGWTPEQFLQLCFSPYPIVAGCVPLKTYPIVYNYLPFKADEQYFKNALRTPDSTRKFREAKGMAEVQCAKTGTGFLCIDRQVLEKLSETADTYIYPNPFNGQQDTHWDFFGCKIDHGQYLSEDWAFCDRARDAGYDIRVNLDVHVNHIGQHVFRVNNSLPIDVAPEQFRPHVHRLMSADPEQLERIDEALKDIVDDKDLIPTTVVHAPKADQFETASQ